MMNRLQVGIVALEKLCHVYGRQVHYYQLNPTLMLLRAFYFADNGLTVSLSGDVGQSRKPMFKSNMREILALAR